MSSRRNRMAALLAALGALASLALPASGLCAEAETAIDPTAFAQTSLREWWVPDGSSRAPLPRVPSIGWKVRVAGGIARDPTVTSDGEVLLALTSPTIAEYDARGRFKWSAKLGATPAALSPLARDDGSRLVFTEAAEARLYSRSGRLLATRDLPFGTLDETASVAALPDGGLLIASGRRLARLDATLRLVFHGRVNSDIKAVFGGPSPLVVGVNGAVYEVQSGGGLTRRGSFAGRVDAVTRVGERRLLAILDRHRISELDLERDAVLTRLAEADLNLYPRLSSNARGEARAIAQGELLLAFDADGREHYRAPLPSTVGVQRPSQLELVLGPDGSALVAPAGSDILAIAPDGSVSRVAGTACAEPLRPAGMRAGSAVVACRSGIVVLLRDQ